MMRLCRQMRGKSLTCRYGFYNFCQVSDRKRSETFQWLELARQVRDLPRISVAEPQQSPDHVIRGLPITYPLPRALLTSSRIEPAFLSAFIRGYRSFPRQASGQLRRFGEAAVAVSLTLARGFLVTGILWPKLAGSNHIVIAADLTRTAGLDARLH